MWTQVGWGIRHQGSFCEAEGSRGHGAATDTLGLGTVVPTWPGILAACGLAAQSLLWPPQDSPHQHKPHRYDPKDTQEVFFQFDKHLKKQHDITSIELQRKKSF